MFLTKQDLPGIIGGVVLAISWLLLISFENFTQPILGGLIFSVGWIVSNRFLKKD